MGCCSKVTIVSEKELIKRMEDEAIRYNWIWCLHAIYSLGSPYSADCQRQVGHITENIILYLLQFKQRYLKIIQCVLFWVIQVTKEAITNTEGWREN